MADIVAAFGVTHAVVMVRTWERASQAHRDAVRAGYDEVARRLRAARPDVVLMVASDHFQSFFLDNMPAFCLGVGGRSVGRGDGGLPRYELTVHEGLARGLLAGLVDAGFDLAFGRDMPLDHAFMTPVHLLFPQADLPIVPLFQNCGAPPLPSVARCLQLGSAIRTVLADIQPGLRVALIVAPAACRTRCRCWTGAASMTTTRSGATGWRSCPPGGRAPIRRCNSASPTRCCAGAARVWGRSVRISTAS